MVGLLLLCSLLFQAVVAESQPKACTPDDLPRLRKKGLCSNTDGLEATCIMNNLEVKSSKDCAEFEGSWCCYDPNLLRKKSDLQKTTLSGSFSTKSLSSSEAIVSATTALPATNRTDVLVTSSSASTSKDNFNNFNSSTTSTPVSITVTSTAASVTQKSSSEIPDIKLVTLASNTVQRKICIPNSLHNFQVEGFCSNTANLNELCGRHKLAISVSNSCSEFEGSWCCYDTPSLAKKAAVKLQGTTAAAKAFSTVSPVTRTTTLDSITSSPIASTPELITEAFSGAVETTSQSITTAQVTEIAASLSTTPVAIALNTTISLVPVNASASIASNFQLKSCTPNDSPRFHNKGVCSSTAKIDEICSLERLVISASKDCSEFDGSWCCYDEIALRKEVIAQQPVQKQQSTTLAPITTTTEIPVTSITELKELETVTIPIVIPTTLATTQNTTVQATQRPCTAKDMFHLQQQGICVTVEDMVFCAPNNLCSPVQEQQSATLAPTTTTTEIPVTSITELKELETVTIPIVIPTTLATTQNTTVQATQRPCTVKDMFHLKQQGICVTEGDMVFCSPNNLCSPF